MPATTPTATACHFCGSTGRLASTPHWPGSADYETAMAEHKAGLEYGRVDACADCRTAGRTAKFPARPRRPRATTMPATDGNYMAMLMGATRVRAR